MAPRVWAGRRGEAGTWRVSAGALDLAVARLAGEVRRVDRIDAIAVVEPVIGIRGI